MAYKVIPQVEFDKAVQRVRRTGLARRPAENVVLALWRAAQDLKQDFRTMLLKATAKGKLDVDQKILDRINKGLPKTIRYNRKVSVSAFAVVVNEFVYNEYQYITEDDIDYESEAGDDLIAE